MTENYNCDGNGPHLPGAVKRYPIHDNAALILCHMCWAHENIYNFRKHDDAGYPQQDWHKTEPYAA